MDVTDSVPVFNSFQGRAASSKRSVSSPLYLVKNSAPKHETTNTLKEKGTPDRSRCWYVSRKNYLRRKQLKQSQVPSLSFRHVTYYPSKITENSNPNVSSELAYDMSSFPRGVAVILNMYQFDASTGLDESSREGTQKDADNIKDVFLDLGFIVHRYDDVTRTELFHELRMIGRKYSSLSCFACAILSHGQEGYIYAYDGAIHLSDIFSVLETPDWKGKPRLFFVEACRGGNGDANSKETLRGDKAGHCEISTDSSHDTQQPVMLLRRQADFFYSYSTTAGNTSYRNTVEGSWYVQKLCEAFLQYSRRHHLSELMAYVNEAISSLKTNTGNEQEPSMVNQLTKDLYFCPPYGQTNIRGKKPALCETRC